MKRRRTLKLELALLLVLILPVQGLAAALSCAAEQHCAHGSAAVQHHGCGACCAAAIVVTPLHWAPPRSANPQPFLPSPISPPLVVLDRLDRPPRFR